MFTKTRLAFAAVFVACLALVPISATAIPPAKITATPSSSSLAPGQSVQVNFSLAEPIICLNQDSTCLVSLDFSPSQTLGVTVTPTPMSWAWTDWAQPRSMIVMLGANTTATYPQVVVLSALAQSNSEYYSAFRVDVTINLAVPDTRPTPVPDQLAMTGDDSSQQLAWAWFPLLAGTVLLSSAYLLRRQHRR